MRLRGITILTLGIALACSAAFANVYTASMLGANEVPPTGSSATGFTMVTITGNFMQVDVNWTALIGGPPAAAHIHCCVAPGSNVGVAVGFPSFPATLSGTYSHTFDLLDPTIYTSTFLSNFGGGTAVGAEAALIAGLNGGMAYSNIHNDLFSGGEIRGLLAPVPEPSNLLLMTPGLGIAMALRRRLVTK